MKGKKSFHLNLIKLPLSWYILFQKIALILYKAYFDEIQFK